MNAAPHLRAHVTSPWPAERNTGLVGFVPDAHDETTAGRASLTFSNGAFDLTLRPLAIELRRMAHLCTVLADRLAIAEQRPADEVAA